MTRDASGQSGINNEFFNFIIKVTYKNSSGDEIVAVSDEKLVCKLVDFTIRRGRVGINTPQNFEYISDKNDLSTLVIYQRATTQVNQPETIKIVGSEFSQSGPSIGFYGYDGHCYGHIYGSSLESNTPTLRVMTIDEVQQLFVSPLQSIRGMYPFCSCNHSCQC